MITRLAAIALVFATAGVARADGIPDGFAQLKWEKPTALEWVTLAPAVILTAADVSTTLSMSPNGYEANPLLGHHPSRARILATGAAGEGLLIGTWYALPPRMRWTVPLCVTAVEGLMVAGNLNRGLSFRWPW